MGLVDWFYDRGWTQHRPILYGQLASGSIIGSPTTWIDGHKWCGVWPLSSDGWPNYTGSFISSVDPAKNFPFGLVLQPWVPPW